MVRTYNPNSVYVIVGAAPIGGFADGTFIKVSRSENTFDKVMGIDGAVSRAKTLNKSGEISITLEQTSMSNDILSALMLADELTNSGIVPIAITDIGSLSVFVSAFAWIRKPTEAQFSKDLNAREWIFDAADIDTFVGGNIGSSPI